MVVQYFSGNSLEVMTNLSTEIEIFCLDAQLSLSYRVIADLVVWNKGYSNKLVKVVTSLQYGRIS